MSFAMKHMSHYPNHPEKNIETRSFANKKNLETMAFRFKNLHKSKKCSTFAAEMVILV